MWFKNIFSLSSSRGKVKLFLSTQRQLSKYFCKTKYKMNVVYLRHQPNDQQFQINFQYKNQDLDIDRVFNFSRNVQETIQACTDRIRTNMEKEFLKKFRKKKVKVPKDIAADLGPGDKKKKQPPADTPKV